MGKVFNMKNQIAFIFGAGISIPAKIKSTDEITEEIFHGETVVRGTAQNYFQADNVSFDWDPMQKYIPRIKSFLEILYKEIFKYSADTNVKVNYEDVYYFLDFIYRNYFGSEKNPAFKYLLKNIETELLPLLSPIDPILKDKIRLEKLLSETKIYIKDLVVSCLIKEIDNFDHLRLLTEVIDDDKISSIEIFTLNHDTILEQYFNKKNQKYCDGFGENVDGFQFWDPTLFDKDIRIKLYKIHGSVSWYNYDEDSWEDRRICKCSKEILWRDPRRPIILIGTYNKLSEYIRGIYIELFYRFQRELNNYDTLIISGYSFSDRAINEKIIDWTYSFGKKKMFIIDPNLKVLKNTSKFAISNRWDNWVKNNLLVEINSGIESCTLQALKDRLS